MTRHLAVAAQHRLTVSSSGAFSRQVAAQATKNRALALQRIRYAQGLPAMTGARILPRLGFFSAIGFAVLVRSTVETPTTRIAA